MPVLTAARSAIRRAARWTYDAATPSNRRRAPRAVLQSEDAALPPSQRRLVVAGTRDLRRNFEVAAWAIRLHLSFIADQTFEAKTGDPGFDRELEDFVAWWGRPANFDAAGRHGMRRAFHLAEACRVTDGDVFAHRVKDGTTAWIEGDRIRDRLGHPEYKHGVRTARSGRALSYALHNRAGSGFAYDRDLPARYVDQLAYFDRFDQTRGVSPLAPALNRLRDVYEGFDYALAKAKLSQLFGLALFREDDESVGDVETREGEDGEEIKSAAEIRFGEGPFQLDLAQDDKVDLLESKTPSTEFGAYSNLMIEVALKALDIPMIYFDESRTNFSGARGAVILYEMACRAKQADVIELRTGLTYWRLALAVLDGDLSLPRGWELRDVEFDWIPAAMHWINPLQEVKADVEAIREGLNSPQRVCKRRQVDFDDILTELAEARQKLNALPPAPGKDPRP